MKTTTTTANGNGSVSKAQAVPLIRQAKPILPHLDSIAEEYEMSAHAVQQMTARHIGPMEVLSAIKAPDSIATHEDDSDRRVLDRGDIRVVVDTRFRRVVTVIDLDEDCRDRPRSALTDREEPKDVAAARRNKARPAVKAVVPKRKPLAALNVSDAEQDDLKWLLAEHATEDIRYLTVTPAIATTLLGLNTHNRRLSAYDSDDLANEMAAGKWQTTHQGIALGRDRVLLDGQHRLQAIVDSGMAVRMPVAVGVDPEAFTAIDTGRVRRPADSLHLIGEGDTILLAGTVRLISLFERGHLHEGNWRRTKIHTDTHVEMVRTHGEAVKESIHWAGAASRSGLKMVKSAAATGHYLLMSKVGPTPLVKEFLDAVQTGLGFTSSSDPRFALRRVVDNVPRRERTNHLALFLKAWAAYANGRSMQYLAFRPGEKFPIVFVPPPDHRPTFTDGTGS